MKSTASESGLIVILSLLSLFPKTTSLRLLVKPWSCGRSMAPLLFLTLQQYTKLRDEMSYTGPQGQLLSMSFIAPFWMQYEHLRPVNLLTELGAIKRLSPCAPTRAVFSRNVKNRRCFRVLVLEHSSVPHCPREAWFKVDFHCRVIFTCVNKIETMYGRSRVNVIVERGFDVTDLE